MNFLKAALPSWRGVRRYWRSRILLPTTVAVLLWLGGRPQGVTVVVGMVAIMAIATLYALAHIALPFFKRNPALPRAKKRRGKKAATATKP